jgi:RNA-binding protein
MELTGKQKRYLRGLGHHLNPTVALGREGLSEAVARKTHLELEAHELIKIKVGDGCLDPAKEVGPQLAEQCGAALVQVIGHTILLYRRRKKDPEIVLPKDTPAPKGPAAG